MNEGFCGDLTYNIKVVKTKKKYKNNKHVHLYWTKSKVSVNHTIMNELVSHENNFTNLLINLILGFQRTSSILKKRMYS